MFGNFGRLLIVDLTNGTTSDYPISEEYQRLYLGGKGLGARLMLDLNPPDVDPYSEENHVFILTGPLVGLNVMGSARYVVMTKSPLSKYVAEAYGGGFFPYALKATGYDGVILKGISPKPVLLEMIDDRIELVEASDFWGKGVFEVHNHYNEKYGKNARTMLIGPAGENKVRFAAIINDKNRAAARGGVGAVLGSKLFKGIVARGKSKPDIKEENRFKELNQIYRNGLIKDMKIRDTFGVYGTSGGIPTLDKMTILPTKNFSQGQYEDHNKISGQYMEESGLLVGRDTCSACTTFCKRVIEGDYNGHDLTKDGSSLEYETLAAFGSMILNKEIKLIGLANQLCNDYGLDTISTGGSIAFAMEANERGLSEKLGVSLNWGDENAVIETIKKISLREDYGDVIAEGVFRMAEKIGGQDFAMHAKGLEIAYHEPRGKKGLGLTYAVSARGGSHMEGFHDPAIARENANPDLGAIEAFSRFSVDRKAPIVANFENARSFTNCLIICAFDVAMTGKHQNLDYLAELTSAAMGFEINKEEMLAIGERATNTLRMVAVRDGCTRTDDDIPHRFKHETLHYGEEDGDQALTEEELNIMLNDYYSYRGWNDDGIPTTETLTKLKIKI
jgi:aldehyde:ferredoxin oxidoreductase